MQPIKHSHQLNANFTDKNDSEQKPILLEPTITKIAEMNLSSYGPLRTKKKSHCQEKLCYKRVNVLYTHNICHYCEKFFCSKHRQQEYHTCTVNKEQLRDQLISKDLETRKQSKPSTLKSHDHHVSGNSAF